MIFQYLNKWKNILCSRTRKLEIVNKAILPKLIYRTDIIPMGNPNCLLYRNQEADPKSHTQLQETWNSQNNSEKRKNMWPLTFQFQNLEQSILLQTLKITANQISIVLAKARQYRCINRNDTPEISIYAYNSGLSFIMGYYSALKMKKSMSATTWTDFEGVRLSKTSQRKTHTV